MNKIIIGLVVGYIAGFLMAFYVTNDKMAREQARGNMLEIQLYNATHKDCQEVKEQKTFIGEHTIIFYSATGNRTASGKYPKANYTVAVDKKLIPFDTELYIEGIGYVTAHDTGAKIKGKRLDVFVNSKDEAIKKGVQKKKVWIVKR